MFNLFDNCAKKTDNTNLEHIACTEIRKANLANCNFLIYFSRPDAQFAVKRKHRECVRNTAIEFMTNVKFVDKKVAESTVDKVFDKCYADLEPLGRRAKNSADMRSAYYERYLFGY
jgi:inner membrane protease ATP23